MYVWRFTPPTRSKPCIANAANPKTKGGFANQNSLLTRLYAGIPGASARWTHPVQHWDVTLSQLAIHFEGRLAAHMAYDDWLTQSFGHPLPAIFQIPKKARYKKRAYHKPNLN